MPKKAAVELQDSSGTVTVEGDDDACTSNPVGFLILTTKTPQTDSTTFSMGRFLLSYGLAVALVVLQPATAFQPVPCQRRPQLSARLRLQQPQPQAASSSNREDCQPQQPDTPGSFFNHLPHVPVAALTVLALNVLGVRSRVLIHGWMGRRASWLIRRPADFSLFATFHLPCIPAERQVRCRPAPASARSQPAGASLQGAAPAAKPSAGGPGLLPRQGQGRTGEWFG